MSKLRLLLSSLAASAALIPTAQAAPDDVCVRQANAVPGAAIKHPQWWNTSLSNSQRNVRWTGATVRKSGDGATPEIASSRMIWDKASHTAFFEINVSGDPAVNASEDIVMVAVADAAGTTPELFMLFQPLRPCGTLANCTGQGMALPASAINYSQASGSGTSVTWSALSITNPSTDFTVDHPWVEVEEVVSGGSTTYNWTLKFALQVPTDGSGNIRPNLRTYANAVMYMPGPTSGTAVEFPLLCNPSSPTSNDCLAISSSSSSDLPDSLPINNMSTIWPVLDSANPSQCEGVEVIRQLVGSNYNTNNGVVPGTTVPYELPGFQIPETAGARFRAGFHNNSGQAVPAGSVTAEFRIANWGLQFSTWDQATWTLVESATLDDDVSAGGYAGAVDEGSLESEIWVPADSGLALENSHQCVHVQLKSTDSDVKFTVDSTYRNMDILSASVARRPADIDLTDRPLPKGHDKHKVYLLVRSENMPDPARCKQTKNKAYGCAKGGSLVLERKALTGKQKKALKKDFNAGRLDISKKELDALLKQKKRKGKKAEELPYYVVYGMTDTGRKLNLPDAPQTPVLTNFSSYGYNVQHEGNPPEGWEHYIHGAQPVGKTTNLYRMEIKPKTIASVANTVRVLSKETKACKIRPKPNWAVYGNKKIKKLENDVKAKIGAARSADIASVRVTDAQLGCAPPPLRLPCKRGKCGEHSPIDYIEGSRYVGDWSKLSKKPGVSKPFGKKPGVHKPGKKPVGKKPAGKKPAGKVPVNKLPAGKKPMPTKAKRG